MVGWFGALIDSDELVCCGWLIDWLCWLVRWLAWLIGHLIGELIVWTVYGLQSWSVEWCLGSLPVMCWSFGWLAGCLVGCSASTRRLLICNAFAQVVFDWLLGWFVWLGWLVWLWCWRCGVCVALVGSVCFM